jgi:hypothetical protein
MAGPIRISILADESGATSSVNRFADATESAVTRSTSSLEDGTRRIRKGSEDAAGGFDRAGEAADELDTKAMGFRDTMTGVQDSMSGASMIAKGDLFNGFLTLGMGVGDLGSGLYNFLIPGMKSIASNGKVVAAANKIWAATQAALNFVMSANPIAIVVLAIAALVAAIVIAYNRSETFRRIVNGAFSGVLAISRVVLSFFQNNWRAILGFMVNPVGSAVGLIRGHADSILGFFRAIPGAVRSFFAGAGGWLAGAGRAIIDGFLRALRAGFDRVRDALGWLTDMMPSWKGPADRDRTLLQRNGEMVIEGFLGGLESRYGAVERSLGGFTDSLTAAAPAGTSTVTASTSPTGSQSTLVVQLQVEPSGDRLVDTLMELLADRIRVKGGKVQQVLGVGP